MFKRNKKAKTSACTKSLGVHLRGGFSLVELIVVIAVMAVLIAVLAPALMSHVEKSRMQKDDSAMGEVVNAAQISLADMDAFDEAYSYAVDGNYTGYKDSGVSSGRF